MTRTHLLTTTLAVAIALAAGATTGAAQAQKIGFVSSQRVLTGTAALIQAQQTLEREMAQLRAPVDSLQQAIQRSQMDLQRQEEPPSAEEQRRRQQEMNQRIESFRQRATEVDKIRQRRHEELVVPIMKRINEVIETLRREGGFSFIVDVSQGWVIAADPSLDLTDRVIERMKTAQ